MMIDNPTLYQIGQTHLAQGRYAAAERHFLAALAGYRAEGDLVGEGNARNGLGWVYFRQRRMIDAWAEFWQGLTCHQAADYDPGEADSLTGLGLVLYYQGHISEAMETFS